MHTKEPIYTTAAEIIQLLSETLSEGTWGTALSVPTSHEREDETSQLSLFKKDENQK